MFIKIFPNQNLFPSLLFATLDVNHQQDDAQQQTDAADDDVGEAEERILATQQRGRREDDLLGAIEFANRICCKGDKHCYRTQLADLLTLFELTVVDFQRVVSLAQTVLEVLLVVVNATVQLAEARQSGRAHPNDEVFVLKTEMGK